MLLVYYITGHGFGHATRSLTIIDALIHRRPDCRVLIRSGVSSTFLADLAPPHVDIQQADVDTGMVQIDSLQLDAVETARKAAAFYSTFQTRVDHEAALLRSLGATLVLGDIPPLAFAAAAAAGVPSIAIANFTWDWIYEAYPEFDRYAPGVVQTIRDAYAASTRVLRLPFAGGFASMRTGIRDVPLVARCSTRGRDAVRTRRCAPRAGGGADSHRRQHRQAV